MYVQNQAAQLALVLLFDFLVHISTRNAAYGSYISSIERIICILNLEIQHVSWSRDTCSDKDKEKQFSSCNSMSKLREKRELSEDLKTS